MQNPCGAGQLGRDAAQVLAGGAALGVGHAGGSGRRTGGRCVETTA